MLISSLNFTYFEHNGFRYVNPVTGHLDEISHLLLSPHVDDFARVLLGESGPESVVVFDVFLTSLELVQRRLENFDHTFFRDIHWLNFIVGVSPSGLLSEDHVCKQQPDVSSPFPSISKLP